MNYFVEYPLACLCAFSALAFVTAFVYDKIQRFSIREVLTKIARDVGALDRKIYEIGNKYQYFREFVPTHNIMIVDIEKRLKSLEERQVPSDIENRLKVLETFGLKENKKTRGKS